MAYSIMGGLSVATVLTLFMLPAAYVLMYRVRPAREAAQEAKA